MTFTPQKDVNLKILEDLDDRSLLNYCRTNKAAQKLCNDEGFWQRRTLQKFENIKIPYGMTWRKYYLYRLSHDIVTVESDRYPGIKSEVIIEKDSPYMTNLLFRLKEYVNGLELEFKLKDDDKILSILAHHVAQLFQPGSSDDDDDIDFGEISQIRAGNDSIFDLTQEEVDEYRESHRLFLRQQLQGLPQLPEHYQCYHSYLEHCKVYHNYHQDGINQKNHLGINICTKCKY
jgi:hypothetical protein